LARWRNHFCQVLNEHIGLMMVGILKYTYRRNSLVPEASAFEAEMAI